MPSITPVGIDLGTSFCAISWIDPDGQSQMVPNDRGELLTPSVVYFGDDQVAVGAAAADAALQGSDRVAANVKRDMGSEAFRESINGQHYPPEVIQSCILRQLRRDIIATVGEDFAAVITVPAYFDEARRKATLDAAHMSGLPVLDIVNEPTSAALSFGERLGYLSPEGAPNQCLNVLVYDLGGGTFDVSVIRMSAAEIRVLATDGDYELGGENWDERLAECFESRFSLRWPDAAAATRIDEVQLQRLARVGKHALSTKQLFLADVTRDDRQLKVPMTRSEFEDLTADLLERTVFTTRQTLAAAKLVWTEIDRILLVGGSSRMPAIGRALHEMSGITADAAVNPDEAVARGAAIYARYLLAQRGDGAAVPKLRITDVNSHSLGIEGVNLDTLLPENVALIPRNSPLPCEINRSFVTRHDNQPNVKVQLLEGESSLPNHCSRLATATIKSLPPGLPQGTSIEVRYSLQSNGRLAVSASVPGHGANAQIELQRVHGLNDRRVQRWKTIVCRDGGYRDYHDAVAALLVQTPEPDDDWDFDVANTATQPRPRTNLDPAVDFGAPLAASDAIHDHFRATAARPAASFQPTSTPHTFDEASANFDFKRSSPARSARRKGASPAKLVIGTIGGGILGIAIGYYLLCLVRPDLNHLQLNFPGVRTAPATSRSK